MNYKIREMQESDWLEVKKIFQDGIDTNQATLQAHSPEYKEWDSAHLPYCRLVITEDDKIAGFAVLTSVSNQCVYTGIAEVSIYVATSQQGKGIGKILLDHLIKMSEPHNIWTLQAQILEENKASIKLHEKCGFRTVGIREKLGRDRFGNWRNIVLMERRSKLEQHN